MGQDAPEHRDFFISYTNSDQQWAEWIAMQLEQNGYTVFIQAWDFRPGSNFVAEMDRAVKCADRTLLVLSPVYLESGYAFAEWATAFRSDPKGEAKRLLPIRVEPYKVDGLLGPMVYIDLVSLDEKQARERLLAEVKLGRAKPETVAFPGQRRPPQVPADVPFPGPLPKIWNVPFARNPFFTGREDELQRLHTRLNQNKSAAIGQKSAISGLGGIGKTQLALEYAYRYQSEYEFIFWVRADTTELLNASYAEIAEHLKLPERNERESEVIVRVVHSWLQRQSGWLLVFDNADDLDVVVPFLPQRVQGHLLLTTRVQALGQIGIADPLLAETFTPEQGAHFLLKRAGLLASGEPLEQAREQDRQLALAITEDLGSLPLALAQAGAYVETTGTSLARYRQTYQQHRVALLSSQHTLTQGHPEPVATTWNISFERVARQNPEAIELLRLCAFLAPDAIPEELFVEGSQALGPPLDAVCTDAYLFDQAIAALRAYSLLTRNAQEHTLGVHRLVQAIISDALPVQTQREWKQRAILAVHAVFPDTEFTNWSICERLLPHALQCAIWIRQEQIDIPESASLLSLIGWYLHERGLYQKAELLFLGALRISEKLEGPNHPNTASILHNLAVIHQDQGKYAESEPLFLRALQIREQALGPEHSSTASTLHGLARLYSNQGKDTEAELLYLRALQIREHALGPQHPSTASTLHELARSYQNQEKYVEAEPLLLRALQIREQALGPLHPSTACILHELARQYRDQGKYAEAELLFLRALQIREQALGPQHPDTGSTLHALAHLYQNQGRYAEAEPLYLRALQIKEHALGPEHPYTAHTLYALAHLYQNQGKYAIAEPLSLRVLHIHEQALGSEHPDTAATLDALAALYQAQGKYDEAEPLYLRALHILGQTVGPEHPYTRTARKNYADLLRATGRDAEAEMLEEEG